MDRKLIFRSAAFASLIVIGVVLFQDVRGQSDPNRAAANDKVFNVREMGAKGDGTTQDTAAIQSAIEACSKAGGGQVLFPPGLYLSGSLRLRSGVELHFAEESRLIGSQDLGVYRGFESSDWGNNRWNRGLIVGEGLKN